MVFLMCALSIIPYLSLLPLLSLGSVLGGKVPKAKRLSFFLWTAAQDSILTIDNLVKRHLPLVNWCCLCRCDGKRWIIFCFIVSLLMPYGVKFF